MKARSVGFAALTALATVAMTACGGASQKPGTSVTTSGSQRTHSVATQPVTSAFANWIGQEARGGPAGDLNRFVELRFIPSAPFQIGIELTNDASGSVTLADVRAVFPRGSVFRQLGTALAAADTRTCAPNESCPGYGGGITQSSNGVLRPHALRVAPGEVAAVQLNFRFLGCPEAGNASLQNIRWIEVSYRDSSGTIIHQRVRLGHSTLRVETPHPCSK
jgi:hypothetical protein